MAPNTTSIPQLKRHKGSGQAYVYVNRRRLYLGRWGAPETEETYRRWAAEWLTTGGDAPATGHTLSVAEVTAAFVEGHTGRYTPRHWQSYVVSIGIAVSLYGREPCDRFGPRALQACRAVMVKLGWNRKTVNMRAGMLVRVFKWGVSQEIVPASVWHGLRAVSGLRRGEAPVPEPRVRTPVSDTHVSATLEQLSPVLADMVRVQRAIGCRPGELLAMTTAELDTTEETWWFRPTTHKNINKGVELGYPVPRAAREILTAYLRLHDRDAPLFSPEEAEKRRLAELRASRESHPSCNRARDARRAENPRQGFSTSYTVSAYRRAIARACKRASVPVWTPYQLRHARATEIAAAHGIDAARAVLGHRSVNTTAIYAARDRALAANVAEQVAAG